MRNIEFQMSSVSHHSVVRGAVLEYRNRVPAPAAEHRRSLTDPTAHETARTCDSLIRGVPGFPKCAVTVVQESSLTEAVIYSPPVSAQDSFGKSGVNRPQQVMISVTCPEALMGISATVFFNRRDVNKMRKPQHNDIS